MTSLPNPGVLTITRTFIDPLTEELDGRTDGPIFLRNPTVSGGQLTWDDGESSYGAAIVGQAARDGLSFVINGQDDVVYRIRAVDPYDALILSPGAGVPQPVEAIRASLLGGGPLATELDAVVAGDNGVVTLMLDTASGIYVRFGKAWQLLSSDSTALEDTSLVAVGPAALDVWDAADATNTPISVGDLPIVTGQTGRLKIIDPAFDTESVPALTASVSIPDVATLKELPGAIAYAKDHVDARWFVEKRAEALGAEKPVW